MSLRNATADGVFFYLSLERSLTFIHAKRCDTQKQLSPLFVLSLKFARIRERNNIMRVLLLCLLAVLVTVFAQAPPPLTFQSGDSELSSRFRSLTLLNRNLCRSSSQSERDQRDPRAEHFDRTFSERYA